MHARACVYVYLRAYRVSHVCGVVGGMHTCIYSMPLFDRCMGRIKRVSALYLYEMSLYSI